MLIEQPPRLYRLLFPKATWRMPTLDKTGQKSVYLTFDDGPVPFITPWVLDRLREREIAATFFMVGDNVHKYPHIYEMVVEAGHEIGNHTYHHLQGLRTSTRRYLSDALRAQSLIGSDYFRPPHGHMRLLQSLVLSRYFRTIMWDVVTRDYSTLMTPEQVLQNVHRYTRDGSVIVFHDSIKAWDKLSYALPRALDWLKEEGYVFRTISEGLKGVEKKEVLLTK